jgi:N4-gp56 family major capsid protein
MSASGRIYNDGADTSSIGTQLQDFYHQKKALIELKKQVYFTPLASVTDMPKHFGKKIKRYHYMPLLDDRNLNDQGIDAAGALLDQTKYYVFEGGALVPDAEIASNSVGFATEALAVAAITDPDNQTVTLGSGNLYGSSKDVGTIAAKLPALSEHGGRVNRVGFKRITLEGSLEKFGFFEEYTQESMDFDTDAELSAHINREMLRGATEMTEDMLQIDILNHAGVNRFCGAATSKATTSGATGSVCEVTYADLSALSIELDNNRCPKETKVITGTRMVDTNTIPAARALLIGSEMIPTIERMTDHFGDQAFIPAHKYAAGTQILNGEIGTVGYFRIVVVPEMMHWEGAGAAEGTNAGYHASNGRYNVYPMLVIGSESFTTIGFQTDGKTTKFKIFHKKPGLQTADRFDPYGEKGFMSIKWYYGFMALRTERLALIYSVGRI